MLRTPRHKQNEKLLLECWADEAKLKEQKDAWWGVVVCTVVVICTAFILTLLLTGCAQAQSLGNNEAEFQATKTKISKAIEGTGATLSEVKVPKLTEEEMNRINQAIKQLKEME